MIDSDTGVLSLSNKRRQGMKPVYQLNVSVSDGVFTNTAQVRRRLCICGPLQSAPPSPPTPGTDLLDAFAAFPFGPTLAEDQLCS